MSKIPIYSFEQIHDLSERTSISYENNQTLMLLFEKWKCTFLPIIKNNPRNFGVLPIDYSKPVRVAPSALNLLRVIDQHKNDFEDINVNAPPAEKDLRITQLCRDIFQPKLVIDQPQGFTIPGELTTKGVNTPMDVPVWFNSTLKGINLRMGFANLDNATPGAMRLDDNCVHGMIGGATGSGKSVALNTIISSAFLEYPPWELDFYLADMKIVELIRYANRVASPHVSMVGATGSTEFVVSLLGQLRTEIEYRQKLFTTAGTQKLEDFRNKYDLAMPRIILVVDEFVQLFENIKDAADAGCTDSEDQKRQVISYISYIARIGRSFGVHMLLSSQSLDGALDDQTSNQFAAGATLKASAGVSKALIGNDAGVRIVGKGKGIVNPNKLAQDESANVYTRIPYIESELSEEEAAAGKITYLQDLLSTIYKLAESVGWKNRLYFYDETANIPYQYFNDDMADFRRRQFEPDTGNETTDRLFLEEITKVITLGRPIKYSETVAAGIDLKIRRGHSILLGADDIAMRAYMLQLLLENMRTDAFEHYAVMGDIAIFNMCGVERILPQARILRAKTLPPTIMEKYQNRKSLLAVNTFLEDQNQGQWSTEMVYRFVAGDSRAAQDATAVAALLDGLFNGLAEEAAVMEEIQKKVDSYILPQVYTVVSRVGWLWANVKKMTDNFTKSIKVNDFSRVFVWFLGLDSHEDISSGEIRKAYGDLLMNGPAVGIHSIVTADIWEKVGALAQNCNFVLENCSKNFFMDCQLPVKVNINPNSFQLIDREAKVSTIIRMYNIRGKVE